MKATFIRTIIVCFLLIAFGAVSAAIASAEKNREHKGKPLFLMAALQYVLKNNLHGTSLNELMYTQHTRQIKELFLRIARDRADSPDALWRAITNPRNPEMQKHTRWFISNHGDVSKAFSELKPSAVKHLLESFENRMDGKANIGHSVYWPAKWL